MNYSTSVQTPVPPPKYQSTSAEAGPWASQFVGGVNLPPMYQGVTNPVNMGHNQYYGENNILGQNGAY